MLSAQAQYCAMPVPSVAQNSDEFLDCFKCRWSNSATFCICPRRDLPPCGSWMYSAKRSKHLFFFYTAQFLLSVLWFVPFSVVPDLSQTQTRSSRHSTWSNHCLSLSSWKSSIEQNWFFLACGIFFSVFPFISIIHLPFGFYLCSHCL